MEKAIPNTTKACIHRSKKRTTTQKKTKAGFNQLLRYLAWKCSGLFSKEKIREEISKEKVKKTG